MLPDGKDGPHHQQLIGSSAFGQDAPEAMRLEHDAILFNRIAL